MGATAEHGRLDRLHALGYATAALEKVWSLAGGKFDEPRDIARVLENIPYEEEGGEPLRLRSAQASLLHPRINDVNAAILAYALLDCFPEVHERLLLIERCERAGVEYGHVVTLYRNEDGCVGAFGKSRHAELACHVPLHGSETDIALRHARCYVGLGIVPRYFGTVALEDAARGIDWRTGASPLEDLLHRLVACHGFAAS